MACVWGLYCHWRKAGDRNFSHPHLVCLHFIPDARLTPDHLFCARISDEHQKIYPFGKAKSC